MTDRLVLSQATGARGGGGSSLCPAGVHQDGPGRGEETVRGKEEEEREYEETAGLRTPGVWFGTGGGSIFAGVGRRRPPSGLKTHSKGGVLFCTADG